MTDTYDYNYTGTLDQPFQFSTKRYFGDLGMNDYGYRFYSPAVGRWNTRDPIGEAGGINLYGMVVNDPVNTIDLEGLNGATEGYSSTFPYKITPWEFGGMGGSAAIAGGAAFAGWRAWSSSHSDSDNDSDNGKECDWEKICEERYDIDIASCRQITKTKGKKAGTRCYAAAAARYAACLRQKPKSSPPSPLHGWW